MPDPLDYRDPATPNAPKPPPSRTRAALLVGAFGFFACVLVMLMPLVIPLGPLAKFVVTPAFVGACAGLSITTNALIDRWRGRGGKGVDSR